jgi:hypothetical protein
LGEPLLGSSKRGPSVIDEITFKLKETTCRFDPEFEFRLPLVLIFSSALLSMRLDLPASLSEEGSNSKAIQISCRQSLRRRDRRWIVIDAAASNLKPPLDPRILTTSSSWFQTSDFNFLSPDFVT